MNGEICLALTRQAKSEARKGQSPVLQEEWMDLYTQQTTSKIGEPYFARAQTNWEYSSMLLRHHHLFLCLEISHRPREEALTFSFHLRALPVKTMEPDECE